MKLKSLFSAIGLGCMAFTMQGAQVRVAMNTISTTMSLFNKETGEEIETGTPENKVYTLDIPSGEYVLTAYATDGTTVNGTIVLNVVDESEVQQFDILTCTAYATNSGWALGTDYDFDVSVDTKEGRKVEITAGNSTTEGRKTFLALKGNSFTATFTPSEQRNAEGFTTLYKSGTLTTNTNVTGAIPTGADYTVVIPAEASLQLGIKFTHFKDFSIIEPVSVENDGDTRKITYKLANGQVYNYRTWQAGGITHAGYFTMNSDPEKCPELVFTTEDFGSYNPKQANHDVNSNNGYETGDIFVNINPRGHLAMNIGDIFDAHAMRTWELTDNSTNNYFIEPDFHYTVIGLDGQPSTGVIEIDDSDRTSAWAQIKAIGSGTAIVLVTYDAIRLNYYSNNQRNNYMGGEYWGAIWPENTGVYVVTVGEDTTEIEPNMTVNESYNQETLKLAGKYVDAEHDVFYYLDTDNGAEYTFTPQGASEITVAYPTIGENAVTYSSFGTDGVIRNEDGSCTLLLKQGRQIVRLADASGKAVYQVLTAKPVHREITNASRPGSAIFQPGDEVKIQYSGLFHPANKLAGIYNMSAYVTYNGIPNGSSLIQGSGQYTFGSAPAAQAITISIPDDYDAETAPELVMNDGVIQVNGFGDPIGSHRNISKTVGRSPNFTAAAHKTYFGYVPEIKLSLSPIKTFKIMLEGIVDGVSVEMTYNGKALTPDEDGLYSGTYGTYTITAQKEGYRCFRSKYSVADDADGLITFRVNMEELNGAWDGSEKTEPTKNGEDVYEITTPAELAWFAQHVNSGTDKNHNAILVTDLHLGNFEWTPIGSSTSKTFSGRFEGQGHKIEGLYINTNSNYQGLFGCVKDAAIDGLSVYGSVTGKQYVGGIMALATGETTIDRCANNADVSGTNSYVGGVVGYLNSATARLTNCYNVGNVSGTTNCGGVAGSNNKDATIENVYSIGDVSGTTVGACIGGTTAKNNVSNAFSTKKYHITDGNTQVSEEQMASGEIAYRLGAAFGQEIGKEPWPVLGGKQVFYDEENDVYHNERLTDGIADTDGIEAIPEIYYNLQGIASTTPWHGLNIVRMSDGTTRKIFTK